MKRWHALVIAALIGSMVISQFRYAWGLGDGLSPVADTYSEANVIRAGEGFADKGFLVDWALPDIVYGDRFPEWGFKADSDLPGGATRYIYTRFPPGPDWMVGLGTTLFGKHQVFLYRLFPLTLALVAFCFFWLVLWQQLAPWQVTALAILFHEAPMTKGMMHGLHSQSYNFSLLLIQLAFVIRGFRRGNFLKFEKVGLLILGFLQGWLSYDFAIVAAGAAFSFVPLYWVSRKQVIQNFWPALLLPGLGYGVACALHFAQVLGFYGGWQGFIADYGEAALRRSVGKSGEFGVFASFKVLWVYLSQHVAVYVFFRKNLWWLSAVTVLFLALGQWLPARARLTASLCKRGAVSVVLALMVSSGWIFLMTQHAAVHFHFVPRHFFILYWTLAWILVVEIGGRLVLQKNLSDQMSREF
jgi:hypothetical protein